LFCPVCGDEYRAGYDRCVDCGVELVEQLPRRAVPEPFELVTVLESGSQSLTEVVKSILDSAGIPYVARNERLQDLFGWGRFGTGFNVAIGPVRFQVPREREEEARALLTEIEPGESEES
jgi:hypothetical protein